MQRSRRDDGGIGRAARAVALLLAFAASGCAGGIFGSSEPASPAPASPSRSSSFTERMNAYFFGSAARPGDPEAGSAPQADVDCPSVDIRSGASTLSVAAPGGEPNATNLRYQASIGQMARECAVLGPTMTIKVGVQGRIILGPLGGPGQVEVPMRLALVHEGIEPKTVWTKFYRVPVTIPPGQTNIPFVHVEEDITFPTPKRADLEAYVVYVGFDPAAMTQQPVKKKPEKKPRASR